MKRKLTALFLAATVMATYDSHACTNILVSKGATVDGSTMITYTADSHQLYGCLYFHPAATYPAGTMIPANTSAKFRRLPQPIRLSAI